MASLTRNAIDDAWSAMSDTPVGQILYALYSESQTYPSAPVSPEVLEAVKWLEWIGAFIGYEDDPAIQRLLDSFTSHHEEVMEGLRPTLLDADGKTYTTGSGATYEPMLVSSGFEETVEASVGATMHVRLHTTCPACSQAIVVEEGDIEAVIGFKAEAGEPDEVTMCWASEEE